MGPARTGTCVERFEREDEEADLLPAWTGSEDAADLTMSGALSSPTAVIRILTAVRAEAAPG
jgi:hypothetical protein